MVRGGTVDPPGVAGQQQGGSDHANAQQEVQPVISRTVLCLVAKPIFGAA
jgi:hypothetical protein